MHATLPLLRDTDFPAIRRGPLQTLQVNLGYRCNQSCLHCHVNAGPSRREMMDGATLQTVVAFLQASGVRQLDLTGGAPELHPRFRELVSAACALGVQVIDRCNLTILEEPGQEGLAEFLAEHRVGITASLPCYLEENVERQRGTGVYAASIRGLQRLNALGYGQPDSELELNLMYNPLGPSLPPPQDQLETDYRRELGEREGVVFNRLYALTNMPIARFGSTLISHDGFDDYMALLKSAHCADNLETVMCRSLLSVDWQGHVHDCDFNQMLGIPLPDSRGGNIHLSELIDRDLEGRPIAVADHCYGCTAGHGSSCGGALRG
ncbi:MAG TPA: arsenosugar biosynthesis radical SAM (seleno)protein ArsS [Thiohalobacter sp.]|nr:arsenosugar biosynthesis radical SAM (seleno)protein ArsS [Thiohalobacter sp.]